MSKLKKQCAFSGCKKTFTVDTSLKGREKVYCSPACKMKAFSERKKGDKPIENKERKFNYFCKSRELNPDDVLVWLKANYPSDIKEARKSQKSPESRLSRAIKLPVSEEPKKKEVASSPSKVYDRRKLKLGY